MTNTYENFVFKNSDWTWGNEGRNIPDELKLKDGEQRNVAEARHTKTIDFMNLCMKLHHDIWKNVKDNESAREKYNDSILTAGAGLGIEEMREIIEYLSSAETFGKVNDDGMLQSNPFNVISGFPIWTDRDFETYRPGKYSLWPKKRGSVIAPAAFVNYMEALSSQTSEFLEEVQGLSSEASRLLKSSQENDWSNVKDASDKLKSTASIASVTLDYFRSNIEIDLGATNLPLPKELTSERKNQIIDSYKQLSKVAVGEQLLATVSTVTGIVNKINAIGTAAVLATRFETEGGLSEEEGLILAGLHYAVGFVPIFGPAYAHVISSFCGYLPEFRKIVAGRALISTDVEAYLRSRGQR